jgi:hypothetical protein
MKQSLYNIKDEYLTLINSIEEMEGEITPEIEAQLKINEAQLQSKSIAYLSVIKKNEHFEAQLDEEIKRLQGMKKRATLLKDNLKSRLLDAVTTFGEFETEFNKFGTRKSESVEVENVNSLPNEYKITKVVETADKKALKEALKKGEKIEGVTLNENLNLKIN